MHVCWTQMFMTRNFNFTDKKYSDLNINEIKSLIVDTVEKLIDISNEVSSSSVIGGEVQSLIIRP